MEERHPLNQVLQSRIVARRFTRRGAEMASARIQARAERAGPRGFGYGRRIFVVRRLRTEE